MFSCFSPVLSYCSVISSPALGSLPDSLYPGEGPLITSVHRLCHIYRKHCLTVTTPPLFCSNHQSNTELEAASARQAKMKGVDAEQYKMSLDKKTQSRSATG